MNLMEIESLENERLENERIEREEDGGEMEEERG